MAKKKSFEKLAFLTPAFNHKGVDYTAKELEARIANGDEEAIALVIELEALGHVVPAGEEVKPLATEASLQEAVNKAAELEEANARLLAEIEELKKKQTPPSV